MSWLHALRVTLSGVLLLVASVLSGCGVNSPLERARGQTAKAQLTDESLFDWTPPSGTDPELTIDAKEGIGFGVGYEPLETSQLYRLGSEDFVADSNALMREIRAAGWRREPRDQSPMSEGATFWKVEDGYALQMLVTIDADASFMGVDFVVANCEKYTLEGSDYCPGILRMLDEPAPSPSPTPTPVPPPVESSPEPNGFVCHENKRGNYTCKPYFGKPPGKRSSE